MTLASSKSSDIYRFAESAFRRASFYDIGDRPEYFGTLVGKVADLPLDRLSTVVLVPNRKRPDRFIVVDDPTRTLTVSGHHLRITRATVEITNDEPEVGDLRLLLPSLAAEADKALCGPSYPRWSNSPFELNPKSLFSDCSRH